MASFSDFTINFLLVGYCLFSTAYAQNTLAQSKALSEAEVLELVERRELSSVRLRVEEFTERMAEGLAGLKSLHQIALDCASASPKALAILSQTPAGDIKLSGNGIKRRNLEGFESRNRRWVDVSGAAILTLGYDRPPGWELTLDRNRLNGLRRKSTENGITSLTEARLTTRVRNEHARLEHWTVSPDRALVLVAHNTDWRDRWESMRSGSLELFEVETGKLMEQPPFSALGPVRGIEFLADGKTILFQASPHEQKGGR